MSTATKFCSECGKSLETVSGSRWPFRIYCLECSPRPYNRAIVGFIGALTLVGAGFLLARWTIPPLKVQLIGTPIEKYTGDNEAGTNENGNAPNQPSGRTPAPEVESKPVEEADVACGAPTRSGRPCRRKVKGGGHCWQHRDKASSASGGKARRKAPDRVL
jgi:hypothetical protein